MVEMIVSAGLCRDRKLMLNMQDPVVVEDPIMVFLGTFSATALN